MKDSNLNVLSNSSFFLLLHFLGKQEALDFFDFFGFFVFVFCDESLKIRSVMFLFEFE